MNVETTVSVYSVVTVGRGGDTEERVNERTQRYLYDHTTIVESYHDEHDRLSFFIVKTTVSSDDIDHETGADKVHGRDTKKLIKEVFYLANYQLDRIASGLGGGIIAGSLFEAQQLLVEAARA